ncbi:hypothetical protein [Methylobacterium sp. Leaf469]|uniref:hypothetical protein n=1 Tax=Methylobacterium sp. Leaf469 TaxID=1736387 RepID=UPI000A400A62|nr:hypothetical protein [Methylobacterium sp. Leaf469]
MAFDLMSDHERSQLIQAVDPALQTVPDYGSFFKYGFLDGKKWGSVIHGGDFKDHDMVISKSLQKHNIRNLVCGGIAGYMDEAYRISSSHEDLKNVRNKYFTPSYFITDELQSFMIVSDSDYYWGFASEKNIINDTFDGDIKKIMDPFRESNASFFGSTDYHNKKIGNMIEDYLEICYKSCRNIDLI